MGLRLGVIFLNVGVVILSGMFFGCLSQGDLDGLSDKVDGVAGAPEVSLQVTLAGDGAGLISSTPAGISCGERCVVGFAKGAVVALTATAANGSRFKGWEGACTDTEAEICTLKMDQALAVVATFELASSCSVINELDLPDDDFQDENCDGIDGTASNAIFVSLGGRDTNLGTIDAPLLTIGHALERAQALGKSQVYVSEGTYSGRVRLVGGISIYGGYSEENGWVRSDDYQSIIEGDTIGIEGIDLVVPTVVDHLQIHSADALSGASSYGLYCRNCSGLVVTSSNIVAGNGGNGAPGIDGATGVSGENGGDGANGSCDAIVVAGGGAGGLSPVGATGGAGGRGGGSSAWGAAGAASADGIPGGSGGRAGDQGQSGGTGFPGQSGASGTNGTSGAAGLIVNGYWQPGAGLAGNDGQNGRGGGGGGGGGGQACIVCDDGTGNGGGGGGGGGAAGKGGTGGGGGGGSFGVFLYNSPDIVLSRNYIQSKNGGTGGAAGSGGVGGLGGAGGPGAARCVGEVGAGGNGGRGGNGGNGGHGGGGAGGYSYAIYRLDSVVIDNSNLVSVGTPGSGGASGGGGSQVGSPGATGLGGRIN